MISNVVNRADGILSTDDVFRPDPNRPDHYIYVSRHDDMIALKNGEKVNPYLIEGIIRSHNVMKQMVTLGGDRQYVAALVEINE
jgi:long-subunit acyl-CoA synthetase (AMP-forming)